MYSITIGVGMVFLRQRAYFPKKRKEEVVINTEQESEETKRDIH